MDITALGAELALVNSESYRYDIAKDYARHLTRETMRPFFIEVFKFIKSDSYRYDMFWIVIRQVHPFDSSILDHVIPYLHGESYRFDLGRRLYKEQTADIPKQWVRSYFLTALKSDSYRTDWLKLTRDAVLRPLDPAAVVDAPPAKKQKTLLPPEDPAKEQSLDEENKDQAACCLCESMVVTMSIFPCGHTNTCYACLKKHFEGKSEKVCPTCRTVVDEVKRVFL
jgi:hypothetical protein